MRRAFFLLGLCLVGGVANPWPGRACAAPAASPSAVDFKRDVLPVLTLRCAECHGKLKASGGLKVITAAALLEGGISGKTVMPGDAKHSYLMERIRGEGGEDRMPLKSDALSPEEEAVIARWIEAGAPVPPEPPPTFSPAPAGLKRLTVSQYRNILRDLLGDKVKLPGDLEPDTLVNGSASVVAALIPLSTRATELFATAAQQAAHEAIADQAFRQRWLPCAPAAPATASKRARRVARPEETACASEFVRRFGRRAWRRPLGADEVGRYARLHATAMRASGDVWKANETLLASLLASPNFLYRVEVGVPDPQDRSRRILTDFELASRLSFFLWGGPPDEQLLDAAEAGKLSTDEGLRVQAERMLVSPRARQTMEAFFVELLRLRRLDRLPQFRSTFAKATPTLGRAMRNETLKVVEEIAFDPKRDFREIFDTRATYVNGELARLYGLPVPEGTDDKEFVRVELPAGTPRAGILGHASFLALNAHPTTSSPTKRGKFIREVLLCQAVPPPPPNVSAKLPEDHEDAKPRTTRDKLSEHRTSPQCNGCHKAMDPMGLAFETFDGLGAFRTSDNGLPIDSSGELDGVPFKDAAELGKLLRTSPKVGTCFARNLFRFAMGHLEEEGEEPLMDELARLLEKDGYHFVSLVLGVVKSRGFRYVAALDKTGSHGILKGKEVAR